MRIPKVELVAATEHLKMSQSLPSHWKEKKLQEICEIVRGASPRPKGDPKYYGGTVPRLMIADVTRDGMHVTPSIDFLTQEGAKLSRPMKQGDLVISISGTVALPCFLAVDACIHDGFIGLKNVSSSDVFLKYLYYHLLFWREKLNGLALMSIFKNLTTDIVKNFNISIPPLPEQKEIAHILQTIQQAKEARQRELQLEQERKAALMQYLFSYGTRNESLKPTEIGEIPESWIIVSFANSVDIANGQVDPKKEPYRKMVHVGSENIEPDTGFLLATKTNEELKIISGNYYFTPEDILYSKIRPYLNKVALPSFDGTCSADVYPVRSKEGFFFREFLFHYLLSEGFKSRAISFQNRTGIPKINRQELGSIKLPKPPLDEQKEIASVLQACNANIFALQREIDLLDELFRAMLEELMTGRLPVMPLLQEVKP